MVVSVTALGDDDTRRGIEDVGAGILDGDVGRAEGGVMMAGNAMGVCEAGAGCGDGCLSSTNGRPKLNGIAPLDSSSSSSSSPKPKSSAGSIGGGDVRLVGEVTWI